MAVCVVIYSRNLLKMAAAKNDYDLPNLTGLNVPTPSLDDPLQARAIWETADTHVRPRPGPSGSSPA